MKAEIITIGDELLIGQVVDTNSAWIGQQLNLIGAKVFQITSVSDDREHILQTLTEAAQRVQVVLITGGLGPTKDDITKKTLCEYFGVNTRFDSGAYEDVERLFALRGREVTDINRLQAEVPANSTVLRNKVGTAPGMWFEENGVVYVSMPGVPYEMKYLMEHEVLPRLQQRFSMPHILHRTLLTQGIGESFLSDKLEDFEARLPEPFKLAYLPSPGMVRLRLSAAGDEKIISQEMDRLVNDLSNEVGEFLYGYDNDTIQELIGKALLEKGWTVSTAESCSGGFTAHLITSVPGSSAYYIGSTVTYSNESKMKILGVPEAMLIEHGAVSEAVVIHMADAVKMLYGTECSISISGVAGPSGGTEEKPVGTVWIGLSVPGKTIAKKVRLGDNRLRTIEVASNTALNMLRKLILGTQI